MKVLIVNTSELAGGAAIAANRLAHALRKNGVEATMLVAEREMSPPAGPQDAASTTHTDGRQGGGDSASTTHPDGRQGGGDSASTTHTDGRPATGSPLAGSTQRADVLTATRPWRHRRHFLTERLRIWAANGGDKKSLFTVDLASDGTDITRLDCFREADVIHLHWVNQGFLSMGVIEKVLRSGKRVVWTLHDMWPATAVCHYAGDCQLFRSQCRGCPQLPPRGGRDTAAHVFRKKLEAYEGANFRVVTCSHWLEEQAHMSTLLGRKRITCIPNPLDTELFSPGDKIESRKALGLPIMRKLVLFASQKVTDERKGAGFLVEMARLIKKRRETEADANIGFISLGKQAEHLAELLSFPVYPMGYVKTQQELARIYRAADLFITPSLNDNLPNTIAEAMACGTPCVAFRTGGIPEMIDHLDNGYVANYRDCQDLATGVETVLETPGMGDAARHYAAYQYDEDRVARKYIRVYEGADE